MKHRLKYKIKTTVKMIYFKNDKENSCSLNTRISYSYRIEHAMETNVLKNISSNDGFSILRKIVYGINIHRKAIKLVREF